MYRTHTSQVTMRILFQWHSDSVPHPTISLWENFYDGTPLTVAGQFRILTGFPTCLSALQNLLYFFIFYHQILIKSIICLYNFFISQYGYWRIISCIIIIASWIFTVADCRVTLYVLLHKVKTEWAIPLCIMPALPKNIYCRRYRSYLPYHRLSASDQSLLRIP